MIAVSLSPFEIRAANLVACERKLEAKSLGHRHRHGGEKRDEWGNELLGAAGELAAAIALNEYWQISGIFDDPDVGRDWQVRTRSGDDGYRDLPIRADDSNDHRYVLVVGRIPDFEVVGWLYGRECKREKWRKKGGDCNGIYFVPCEELTPIT